MKNVLMCLLVCSVAGCKTLSPEPMNEMIEVREQVLIYIESNIESVVKAYTDKLRSAYEQGLYAAYESALEGLTDEEGKVLVNDQASLFAQVQVQLKTNDAWLVNEQNLVLDRLSQQFAVVQDIDRLDIEFHAVVGRRASALEILKLSTIASDQIIAESGAQVQNTDGTTDWRRVVMMIGKVALERQLEKQRVVIESLDGGSDGS